MQKHHWCIVAALFFAVLSAGGYFLSPLADRYVQTQAEQAVHPHEESISPTPTIIPPPLKRVEPSLALVSKNAFLIAGPTRQEFVWRVKKVTKLENHNLLVTLSHKSGTRQELWITPCNLSYDKFPKLRGKRIKFFYSQYRLVRCQNFAATEADHLVPWRPKVDTRPRIEIHEPKEEKPPLIAMAF